MKRATLKSLAALAFLLAVGCAPDRTMLVVRVQSNLSVPDAMDTVRVVVTHAGKEIQNLPFPLTGGLHKLPLQVGLLSPSGGGTDVAITVTGVLARVPVVSEIAITSFIKGKSLVLDMYLAAECVNFDCKDPTKTCTVGQVCIAKNRSASTLPVFDAHPPKDAGADKPPGKDGAAGTGAAGTGATDASDATAAGGAGGGTTDAADAKVEVTPEAPAEVAPEVPACVPTTENCFNDRDDDCDGKSDCADPDCVPTAVCVPRPSGTVGTTVDGAAACPAGFTASTPLEGGLTAGNSCASGCRCGAGTTNCSANLYTHLDAASCADNFGGNKVYTMSTTDPDLCPIPDTNTTNVYGARLDPWFVQTSGCAPTGAPVKPTPVWGKATKFCAADRFNAGMANGCAAGSVCMPRAAAGRSCLMLDAVGTCPAGAAADTWYTGFSDGRTCALCTCTMAGASCDSLVVQMGSDYSCGVDYADIKGGKATCATQSFGVYVPGYQIVGTPTPPTCTPTSSVTGFLTPTGGRTVCCLP
jgi:hypothetical protein